MHRHLVSLFNKYQRDRAMLTLHARCYILFERTMIEVESDPAVHKEIFPLWVWFLQV